MHKTIDEIRQMERVEPWTIITGIENQLIKDLKRLVCFLRFKHEAAHLIDTPLEVFRQKNVSRIIGLTRGTHYGFVEKFVLWYRETTFW